MEKYDFGGWATRNDLKCSDGRVIRRDAFKDNDGSTVPLVWNHNHDNPLNVLGHALLENRDEGVYAYCKFNDTEAGKDAKLLVQHGDVNALSIYANHLKQHGSDVLHGAIREVSLVLAGANPGAFIDNVMVHGEESEDSAIIYTGEDITLSHAEGESSSDTSKSEPAKSDDSGESKSEEKSDTRTVQDVIDGMSKEEKDVLAYCVQKALEDDGSSTDDESDETDDSDEGNTTMKHNVFDDETRGAENVLTHSDEENIISAAKSMGKLSTALEAYAEDNEASLKHGIDDIETLFPDYQDVRPGAPEMITNDQGWVTTVLNKVHKSPISRIRTRQADVRFARDNARAYGYQKGKYKKDAPNIKLLSRTTDPQTVYRKDKLLRDDIIDITDFDVVNYQYQIMRLDLNEELATAMMIGDGREDGDEMKIYEDHIRPIWTDDELYTIHQDVDIEGAKAELQGSDTGAHFGENYIYAEAIIQSALYAREKYKGSGSLDFYCTPHLLNVMLLARDLNGRRIYSSASDLAAALNVNSIQTAEQFENQVRTTSDSKKKKLLGLFVNLADYSLGSTRGGQITRFNQFDIDFNAEKYLLETRLSGALTRVYSAIALEEDVTE